MTTRRLPWMMAFTLAAAAGRPLVGQSISPDRQAVMAPVRQLFDAMRKGDGATAREAFHPGALLATAAVKDGQALPQVNDLQRFLSAVGAPRSEAWDERLYDEQVLVDGPLAVVWAEYSFFRGTTFSHCGVDTFQLVKTGEKWQILALTDTRRTTGCRTTP